MYDTNISCQTAGRFHGNMVVSMRPFTSADTIRAVQITTRFPKAHGAPIHFGTPSLIGISNLDSPNYGDAVQLKPDEVPVFGLVVSRLKILSEIVSLHFVLLMLQENAHYQPFE